MYKRKEKIFVLFNRVVDITVVVLSFLLAFKIREQMDFSGLALFDEKLSEYWLLIVAIMVLWWHSLYFCKVYRSYRGKPVYNVIKALLSANILGILLLTFGLFAMKKLWIHRTLILLFFLVCTILMIIEKITLYYILEKIRASSLNTKYALVVGEGERTKTLLKNFEKNPGAGFRIIGILAHDPEMVGKSIGGHKVIGLYQDLLEFLKNRAVDEVFITISIKYLDSIKKMVLQCEHFGINARVMAYIHNPVKATMYLDELLDVPFISFSTRPLNTYQLYVKDLLDVILATAGLLVSLPLFLLIAAAIKLDSRGPVFFRQERIGMNGRKFKMYKFRSMVDCAEQMRHDMECENELDGPAFKIKCDPRVTRVGKVLRKWSLDELPQLINVIKRQMSIVGPRPLPTHEAKKITGSGRRRQSMLPGITGLWQVSGRNDIDFDTWMKLDLTYIDTWSLWLDCKIAVRTVLVLFSGKGAY